MSDSNSIEAIRNSLGAGELDAALLRAQRLLEKSPENHDAAYLAAVCYRYKNQHDQAQQLIDRLKSTALDKGRIFQEQGHLYKAQGQLESALASFKTATEINPALTASWQSLSELATIVGNAELQRQSTLQFERLGQLPKTLIAVMDLLGQGRLYKAEALCKKYLLKYKTDTEGMRLLADIASRLGAMDEAEFLLDSAVELSPSNPQLKIDYITVLRKRQKFESSQRAAHELLLTSPENPQFQSILAISQMQMGNYAEAIRLFDKVLRSLPNSSATYTARGHALKTWGKRSEAIESYRKAIESDSAYCEAYYSLSNLKTYSFEDQELDAMNRLAASTMLTMTDQVNLHFALGKAYEERSEWQRAFEHYKKGNYFKKQQSGYSASQMSEELAAQAKFFTQAVLGELSSLGYSDAAPIFIVGLPRAGSTLLEQILSSHSQVDGTLELPNMLTIAQQLRRTAQKYDDLSYPEVITKLDAKELGELGYGYIEETKIHRQGAPFFIDKMPNNFRHIGLIKTILPNAKIIDARRHPVACCFSGFKQLFAEGQEFSYSLDDIGQYYNDYVSLMDHWDSVMPGDVLRVYYENVTADLEAQVRRILDYCGLPFEEACLEFYNTERAVRTASSEQVRQPIYQSGVDQWRNFEEYLQPLIEKLQPSLSIYPKF